MLSFKNWNSEIERLNDAINLINRKIQYRCLQILGPEPPADLERGIPSRGLREYYGRTSEELNKTSSDAVIQKLYSERNSLEQKLDYLKRTGEKLENVNTEEAFE